MIKLYAQLCGCRANRASNTRTGKQHEVYFGDAAGFTPTGEEVALDAGCDAAADGDDNGRVAGAWAPGGAGRKPRLLGLLSIFAARLLTTFASFIAVSNKAAFKICFRWLVRPWVICWRTPGLSSVRFSVLNRRSASLKMYHLPLLNLIGCV